MSGKFSANSEDLEKYLERKLTSEETIIQNSTLQFKAIALDTPYHLDGEAIEILNEDRIETGG
jgi:hypothetical protein